MPRSSHPPEYRPESAVCRGTFCPYCQPIDLKSDPPGDYPFFHYRKGPTRPLMQASADDKSMYCTQCLAKWEWTVGMNGELSRYERVRGPVNEVAASVEAKK